MLLPAEVAPLLFHEDARVWGFALEYLAEAHDPAPLTADDVWAAGNRVHGEDRQLVFKYLASFPATPGSVERILAGLRSERDDVVFHHLVGALRTYSADPVRRALGDRRIAARLPKIGRAHLDAVLELADKSFDELWGIVETCTVDLKYGYLLMEPSIYRVNRLAEALARFPEQAAARALDALLDVPAGPRARWVQAFSVRLLASAPHPGALVPLLRVARDDGTFLLFKEWIEDALVQLGTREIVAVVVAGMGSGGDWFEQYGSRVLARIKRPESELALVRMLAATSDVRRCTALGMALCRVCTTLPEALERLHALVSCDHFDPYQGPLDEALLTLSAVQGFQPMEARAWKDRISAREAALEIAGDEWARKLAADPLPEAPDPFYGRKDDKG